MPFRKLRAQTKRMVVFIRSVVWKETEEELSWAGGSICIWGEVSGEPLGSQRPET